MHSDIMIDNDQIRHEKLIDFLGQFSQYQGQDGKPILKKVKKQRSAGSYDNLDSGQINQAVFVFLDSLNIMSGSAGEFNFYTLMQAYIQKPKLRQEINTIIESKLSSQ